jgi:hypothetical protein
LHEEKYIQTDMLNNHTGGGKTPPNKSNINKMYMYTLYNANPSGTLHSALHSFSPLLVLLIEQKRLLKKGLKYPPNSWGVDETWRWGGLNGILSVKNQ